MTSPQKILDDAFVDPAVFALTPGYRALLLVVTGLQPGPSDEASEALLVRAEERAVHLQAGGPLEDAPNIAAWRTAYRAFGAKPQRTRHSLEALTRRAATGLPRVNRLTDIYNAISVLHQLPIGGEDLDAYVGSPHLVRATGEESFDTVAGGEVVIEHPEVGEVVWRDDVGVTCRRWNWRQCRRTAQTDETTNALFILDALDPLTEEGLRAAADDLTTHLIGLGQEVRLTERLLTAADG